MEEVEDSSFKRHFSATSKKQGSAISSILAPFIAGCVLRTVLERQQYSEVFFSFNI